MHYTFDLWAERWRRHEATGHMIIVRYADDTVVGFEHETDARRFWDAMRKRLEELALSLHPDNTRLIKLGRHVADRRSKRGLGKPETLKFLGFDFICERSRKGQVPAQTENPTRPHGARCKHPCPRYWLIGAGVWAKFSQCLERSQRQSVSISFASALRTSIDSSRSFTAQRLGQVGTRANEHAWSAMAYSCTRARWSLACFWLSLGRQRA